MRATSSPSCSCRPPWAPRSRSRPPGPTRSRRSPPCRASSTPDSAKTDRRVGVRRNRRRALEPRSPPSATQELPMEVNMPRKSLLALAAGALLLGGCATYPYDTYAYNDGYYYDQPRYYYGPSYYGPTY